MKISFLLVIPVLILFNACGGGGTASIKPVSVSSNKGLEYNYFLFRKSLDNHLKPHYTITNAAFFTAISNELDQYSLSRESKFSNAIESYQKLIKELPGEEGFLSQRVGICNFKLKNYMDANRSIQYAASLGTDNAELRFYRAMLFMYYLKQPARSLELLKSIGSDNELIDKQDYYAFQGEILRAMDNKGGFLGSYQTALGLNPKRFYQTYDLMPVYLELNDEAGARGYLEDSYKALSTSKELKYKVKAYTQLIQMNYMSGKESLIVPFDLSEVFNNYNNILYCSPYVRTIDRSKGQHLQIPLSEKKKPAFSALYEDYDDSAKSSGIFLSEGMLAIANVTNRFSSKYPGIPRVFATNNYALYLSPTNIYIITSNELSLTKTVEVTNQSNVIMMTNLPIDYYLYTRKADINDDNDWEYLVVGYDVPNKVLVNIFYPSTLAWETREFRIKRSDAFLAVQDINNDGKKEVVLVDDDVYIIRKGQAAEKVR